MTRPSSCRRGSQLDRIGAALDEACAHDADVVWSLHDGILDSSESTSSKLSSPHVGNARSGRAPTWDSTTASTRRCRDRSTAESWARRRATVEDKRTLVPGAAVAGKLTRVSVRQQRATRRAPTSRTCLPQQAFTTPRTGASGELHQCAIRVRHVIGKRWKALRGRH